MLQIMAGDFHLLYISADVYVVLDSILTFLTGYKNLMFHLYLSHIWDFLNALLYRCSRCSIGSSVCDDYLLQLYHILFL
jgi:hypothetical protein